MIYGTLKCSICHQWMKRAYLSPNLWWRHLLWFCKIKSVPVNLSLFQNPSIFNIIPWVPGLLGCWVTEMTDSLRKCLMLQVLFFFIISCKILCKNCFFLFFINLIEQKLIVLSNLSISEIMNKIMLGTSDAW